METVTNGFMNILVCELNTGTIKCEFCETCKIAVLSTVINPRRACAARITVILELLFILKMLTYTTGNGGRKICGIFPETTSFRTTALPALYRAVLTAEYLRAPWGWVWAVRRRPLLLRLSNQYNI